MSNNILNKKKSLLKKIFTLKKKKLLPKTIFTLRKIEWEFKQYLKSNPVSSLNYDCLPNKKRIKNKIQHYKGLLQQMALFFIFNKQKLYNFHFFSFYCLMVLNKFMRLYVNSLLYYRVFYFIKATVAKKKIKIKRIKNLLYFKLFKLKIEKSIFIALKVKSKIYFNSVTKGVGFIDVYKIPSAEIFPKWLHKFFFFDELLSVFYYSLYYKTSELLAKFISKNINNNKRHFNFLKRVKLVITKLYKNARVFNLIGLFISVHGKFQGHLRKRRFRLMLGQTGRSSFDTYIDYKFKRSYTRWGVFSVKVFLFFGAMFNLTPTEKIEFKLVEKNNLKLGLQPNKKLYFN